MQKKSFKMTTLTLTKEADPLKTLKEPPKVISFGVSETISKLPVVFKKSSEIKSDGFT